MEDWKVVTTEWRGDLTFAGNNLTGGEVQMGSIDGDPGISPMELVLVSLAGCTGMDVVSILAKKRQPLQKFKVEVRGLRAGDHPRIYTKIEVKYLLWGDGLNRKAVEQAIQLSEEKYCSVSAMLKYAAEVTSSYQIFTLKVTI